MLAGIIKNTFGGNMQIERAMHQKMKQHEGRFQHRSIPMWKDEIIIDRGD